MTQHHPDQHKDPAMSTPGQRFRLAVEQEKPLQVVGAVNAYAARLAEHSGFKSLYLSGGGVAACSCGIPDLGITTLEDVLIDVRRITDVTELPLLVDIDTGWGGAFNIARAIRSLKKPAPLPCISKTRYSKSAVATARTRRLSARKKW
jgi:methylisocitrate lyase